VGPCISALKIGMSCCMGRFDSGVKICHIDRLAELLDGAPTMYHKSGLYATNASVKPAHIHWEAGLYSIVTEIH